MKANPAKIRGGSQGVGLLGGRRADDRNAENDVRRGELRRRPKVFAIGPNGRARRDSRDSKEDRWHSFNIGEVKERDYKVDSLKWLREESLDDADELPEPAELVTDAIAELEEAVAELNAVMRLLENSDAEVAEA